MNKILISHFIVFSIPISFIFQCAPTVKVISNSPLENEFVHADSLFSIGNYNTAKLEYIKIRDDNEDEEIKAYAQFNLAFLDIFYDNPIADYDSALEEFKRFVTEYPNHPKVNEAKNWIKILTVLRGYSREYKGSTKTLITIKEKCDKYLKQYSILENLYQRCDSANDSLKQQIKVLERVIEEITKSQE